MNAGHEAPDLSLDQLIELQRRADESAAAEAAAAGGSTGDDDTDDDDDDVIVLPWWQRPFNIFTLVVTAALLAGMVGWLIGDAMGNEAHNDVDTGFLQDMRLHHEQAVLMSAIYLDRPDIDPGLAIVASSILQGQTLEVGRMIQLLRDFGEAEAADLQAPRMTWMGMSTTPDEMPGMASEADIEKLGASSGADADQLFVDLMIAHHEGGIHMAEYVQEHGESDEVNSFATGMITGQANEIAELQSQLN